MTLGELADYVNGTVVGDRSARVASASTLDKAGPEDITFLSNPKYEPQVRTTGARAVITAKEVPSKANLILAEDPYYAFMQIVVLLHGHREHRVIGISPRANVDSSVVIGSDTNIHDFVTVQENVKIGARCQIYPGVFIGPDVTIGDDCILYPNAVIFDRCRLGHRVIIQACACIGQDGFGFSTYKGEHHKIPQIGGVVLQDDVEIGSCAVIERGTLDDTVIGKGSKIGDAVAIGHGTKVGPHCLMVPQAGVAGSTILGHHVVLGGQVGVVGHIKVGNLVKVGAQAGVISNVPDGATIVGTPAIDAGKAKRAYALIEYLPELKKKVRELEKQIKALKMGETESSSDDE